MYGLKPYKAKTKNYFHKHFEEIKNIYTFAPSKMTLFYGVMVTRQILVLKFKVRVLVEQQKKSKYLQDKYLDFLYVVFRTKLYLPFNKDPSNPRPNLNKVFTASRLAFVAAIFVTLPTKLLSFSRFF